MARDGHLAGKVLFYNAGTWTWKDWQATYKVPEQDLWDNVGFTLVPAAQKGGKPVTLSHPLVYMVTANSKNQELAFRVLANATKTPELNSKHSVQSAHLAILKSQANDPTYKQDKFLLATGYMLDYTTFIPNHPRSDSTTRCCTGSCQPLNPGRCSQARQPTWRSTSSARSSRIS